MRTVIDPSTITSGGPTQSAMSVTRAAGKKPTRTVGQQGGRMGPPTWGMGGVPGVTIGHVCMSVTRAAGGIQFLQFVHESCCPEQGLALRQQTTLPLEAD